MLTIRHRSSTYKHLTGRAELVWGILSEEIFLLQTPVEDGEENPANSPAPALGVNWHEGF